MFYIRNKLRYHFLLSVQVDTLADSGTIRLAASMFLVYVACLWVLKMVSRDMREVSNVPVELIYDCKEVDVSWLV